MFKFEVETVVGMIFLFILNAMITALGIMASGYLFHIGWNWL